MSLERFWYELMLIIPHLNVPRIVAVTGTFDDASREMSPMMPYATTAELSVSAAVTVTR